MHFSDRLIQMIDSTSPICVGIDPDMKKIPAFIKKAAVEEFGETLEAAEVVLTEFGFGIIDAMEGLAGICKPQLAFFEQYGSHGIRAFEEICNYAKEKGIIVIADGKRNDIGNTSEAYARAFLGKVEMFNGNSDYVTNVDSLTVNPYLGSDGILPFVNICKEEEKGIFVLVKTSNESSGDFQDLAVGDEMLCEEVARRVSDWGMGDLGQNYFSSVGAVVGATYPEEARYLRSLMPNQFFLVPGYGAQGGDFENVRACFNADKRGAIINSSRGINYAYLNSSEFSDENFVEAARAAIVAMKKDLEQI